MLRAVGLRRRLDQVGASDTVKGAEALLTTGFTVLRGLPAASCRYGVVAFVASILFVCSMKVLNFVPRVKQAWCMFQLEF